MKNKILWSLIFISIHSINATNKPLSIDNYFDSNSNFWSTQQRDGFLTELRSTLSVPVIPKIYKIIDNNGTGLTAESIYEDLAKSKPDLIYITDDGVIDQIFKKISSLNIPIIFSGVNQLRHNLKWLPNNYQDRKISGVLQRSNVSGSLPILKRMGFTINSIGIFRGPTPAAKNLSQVLENDIKKFSPAISTVHEVGRTLADWQTKLPHLANEVNIVIPLLPFGVIEESKWELVGEILTNKVKKPTLGVGSLSLFKINGFVVNPYQMGQQAASSYQS